MNTSTKNQPFGTHLNTNIKWLLGFGMSAALGTLQSLGAPVPTAFTYQGQLADGGAPASGIYDLQFSLCDAPAGGSAVFAPLVLDDVPVSNGLFTAQLDFGEDAFGEGARWLEISVRTGDSTNAFTTLTPRQSITAAPLANHALNADVATSALNAQSAGTATAVAWSNITGKPAEFADDADNDTTYSAGEGLDLDGANQFSVHFDGSGSSSFASRSDHHHFGETWSGTSAKSGLDVLNASTSGRALTGRQGAGSGYVSLFGITAGMWGDSHDGWGLFGSSFDGAGVYGLANDSSYNNNATYGGYFLNRGYGAGLFASSSKGRAANFEVPANNNNPALVVTSSGGSHAGLFVVNNAANANDAVNAATSGTGDAVSGYNSGTGHAGRFQIGNAGSPADAVHAETSGSGNAVYGRTTGPGHALQGRSTGSGSAVYARNTGAGAALEIDGGAFKITGAGQNTTTAAFIHQSSAANVVVDQEHHVVRTRINHALCNNHPNALLIVTPRGYANFDAPFGVAYNTSEGAWSITLMGAEFEAFTIGTSFNVLVITP